MGFYRKITSFFNKDTSKNTVSFSDAERFRKRMEDPGEFIYEEGGFIYQFGEGAKKIKWTDIERLVAYKMDLMTVDEIRMDIVWDGWKMTITEETPGWYQFVERLKAVFPGIPADWDSTIVQPPFATNLAVLYEREDRIMPEANNFYASFRGIPKELIKDALEKNDWTSRKAGWTDTELFNSWTMLLLEGDDDEPLLNGVVAFHKNNTAILDKIFDDLGVPYQYEFYDDQKNILLEREMP